MIPKIIHQTAPSDPSAWPIVWHHCQRSVRDHFPGFTYRLWDDNDLEDLVRTRYPWFLERYLSYPRNILRVDAARYMILDTYGGIYIDMDFEIMRDFYNLVPQDRVSLVESCFQETEHVQNSLMVSPRKDPFWNEVFRELLSTYDYYQSSVLDATGPRMLDRVMSRCDIPVHVLPMAQFNPRPRTTPVTQDLYSLHHYTAFWV